MSGGKWWHLKAFDLKRAANALRPHEQNFVTSTELPTKRALDVYPHQNLDAFARLRVSGIETVFDSKQLWDSQPLFWDDQETSGSGTSSTYNSGQASTTLAVSTTTAGKRIRQTKQRFNYQPGKSQLIICTTRLSNATGSGITAEVGQFDDDNGLFFRYEDGALYVVRRSSTSGSAVDDPIEQSNWNLDTMDGNGRSGVTLDPTKTQILFFDYEWLGVGRVRMGFFIDGAPIYCHEFLNTNVLSVVYMSTPNLPLRYSIENDGTGAATELVHICSTVNTEGGTQNTGVLRHADSNSVGSLAAGTVYAVLGIRQKTTHLDLNVLIENISALATSANDRAHWELRFNPTVAGTFTYVDQVNSGVQIAQGAAANTVTGGIEIDGGYFTDAVPVSPTVPNALRLGSLIDGTRDEIVLCVRPITNNITIEASFSWRELL